MGLATAEPTVGPLTTEPPGFQPARRDESGMLENCDQRKVNGSVRQPHPPPPARKQAGQGLRRHRGYIGAGTGLALGGMLGYVALVDPHRPASIYPPCPFKWLTGWNCPFCGGLRMTHDVLDGDLMAAIQDNVFVLVGIPMLAAWMLARRARGKSMLSRPALLTVLVATIAWTVLRNLPAFPLIPTVLGG